MKIARCKKVIHHAPSDTEGTVDLSSVTPVGQLEAFVPGAPGFGTRAKRETSQGDEAANPNDDDGNNRH
jgi:hypothetical protein